MQQRRCIGLYQAVRTTDDARAERRSEQHLRASPCTCLRLAFREFESPILRPSIKPLTCTNGPNAYRRRDGIGVIPLGRTPRPVSRGSTRSIARDADEPPRAGSRTSGVRIPRPPLTAQVVELGLCAPRAAAPAPCNKGRRRTPGSRSTAPTAPRLVVHLSAAADVAPPAPGRTPHGANSAGRCELVGRGGLERSPRHTWVVDTPRFLP